MKYRAYPEYKDSGVEWLGNIPSHWKSLSIKRFAEIINGSTPKSGELLYWDGDIPWVTPADLGKGSSPYVSRGSRNITLDGYESCGTSLVPKHTIILSSRAPIGALGIASNDLCTNQGCKSLVIESSHNSKFLYYVLMSSAGQLNNLGRGTTFLELSSDSLGDYKSPVPSSTEQSQIADFLDHETAKIDALIEKQQRLIALLKEKRQAVISHAVTKGLTNLPGANLNSGSAAGPQGEGTDSPSNPDAPMKDSGIEWLGEVPVHWEVKKFSHCARIRNGQVDPTKAPYMDYTLIAPNHIESETGRVLFTESAIEQGADSGKYLCKKGEVIYSKIRPALAKACLSPSDETICSADMYPISGIKGMTNQFLLWTLLSNWFTSLVILESDRVAMPKINREKLAEVRLPIPPVREQQEICSEIQKRLSKIDSLLEKADASIQLAIERRTALISAAVTGKIDVRHHASRPAGDLQSSKSFVHGDW